MLMSLQGSLQACGKEYKFLEDPDFQPVKNTLDNRMKELSQKGVVTAKKQSQPLMHSEEEKLWELGLLGDSNPEQLLNTVIYLLGVHLALQGVQEHKDLEWVHTGKLQLSMMKSCSINFCCINPHN